MHFLYKFSRWFTTIFISQRVSLSGNACPSYLFVFFPAYAYIYKHVHFRLFRRSLKDASAFINLNLSTLFLAFYVLDRVKTLPKSFCYFSMRTLTLQIDVFSINGKIVRQNNIVSFVPKWYWFVMRELGIQKFRSFATKSLSFLFDHACVLISNRKKPQQYYFMSFSTCYCWLKFGNAEIVFFYIPL